MKKKILPFRLFISITPLLLVGCAGLALDTTRPTSSSSDHIFLGYTKLWGTEHLYGIASSHCAQYGKAAKYVGQERINLDRNIVKYVCTQAGDVSTYSRKTVPSGTSEALIEFSNTVNRMNTNSMQQEKQKPTVNCIKNREWTSGFNKNCVYNCVGSEAVKTIRATDLCPLTIQHITH